MKNKKQKLLKSLLTVFAVGLIGAGAVACGKEEPPVDYGEDGKYYYTSDTEEYWIVLNDNAYQLWLNDELVVGRYTYDGASFVMYIGTEDDDDAEKIPATYEEGILTITYKGGSYRFLEKVAYTVTYNTNGGSQVAAATAINGKSVEKPADPTKENSVFLGWYIDAECTTPFVFGANVITSNITLYAKWADKVAGQTEYTIDFDLGYEGTAPVAQTTIGGKAHNVVTPEREGYTFTGWWISMYEDEGKLSYAYTEDTVFNANTTLFAGWEANATTAKLSAPAVSITTSGAKWSAVAGASSYEIEVVKAGTNQQVLSDSTGSTTYNINFAELDAGDYIINVKAKASVAENDSNVTTRYYKNKGLERVSVFSVIDPSTLFYNAVEGATDYYITVVCGNDEHEHTNFYNGNSTYFNFSNCIMTGDGIEFIVTATAEGYAASVSETFVYLRKLNDISGLYINENAQIVGWEPVANATNYILTITDANGTYTIDNGGLTSYSLEGYTAPAQGGISVSVRPATKGYVSPEAATITFNKAILATPTGLAIDDTTLAWNTVPGATGYLVKINNQEFETQENSYDFSAILDMTEDTYVFNVKAISDTKESTYSADFKATYYAVDSKLTYKNSVVTWTPIIGASYYMVQVNDGYAQRIDGALNSANITLTKAGINTITVKSDIVDDSVTMQVFAHTIELDSRGGSSVDPIYVAKGDVINIKTPTRTGYDFVAWYTAPGGPASNAAIYDDKTFDGVGSMMLFAHWAPKSYTITFFGSGTEFDTIENVSVEYKRDFTLPVPETSDKSKMFAGWYTGVGGTQTQLTDANGNSVAPFTFITDQTAYAKWADNVLQFTLNDDGESYAVSAGSGIDEVAKVYIPTEHEGKPVTIVEAQGFAYCYELREISIPNTVTLIGTAAFNGCSRLQNINIYEVEGTHEVFYWSVDGAVVRKDAASGGTQYLEFFPRAKTGSFTVPDGVETIGHKVFQNSKISEVIIPASVTYIAANAFYNSKNLTTVKFAFEGNTEGLVNIEVNAFTGCTAIKEFYLPAQASDISVDIFKGMSSLEYIEVEEGNINYSSVDGMLCDTDVSNKTLLFCPKARGGIVIIPTGVYNVGEGAFQGNDAILQVIIPSFVTDIGNNAFSNCESIVTVTFNGTRYMPLTIGESAFASCKKLKNVEFEGNNTGTLDMGTVTIGDNAFAGNTRTKSLVIGDGVNVAYVGAYAFANNSRLATIDISDSAAVTEIGAYAFSNITAIRKIVINSTTESIGTGAYSGCSYVTEVSFAPNGQEVTFGDYVFENCSRLSTVSLPATVTKFDGSAFAGCNGINTITVDPANQYLTAENGVLYDKAKTTLMYYPKAKTLDFATELPSTLTTFGAAVFQDNQKITNVTIPASVTTISANAFNNCINLETVTFLTADTTAITLGNYAFANCAKLTTITLPKNTTSIGNSAFSHTPLEAITIPSAVTSIGANAFEYTYITSVEIPASVSFIGNAAFKNCDNLSSFTFVDGNTPLTIGTAVMGEKVTQNKDYGTFVNSNQLTAITLPARLEAIGGYAFYNSPAVITFAQGCNLKTIGDGAFFNAKFATELATLNKLEKINKYAFYGANLTSFTVANTVAEIDRYAFANSKLATITFAAGNDELALNVGNYAFAYSKLETIEFPTRISSIGATQEEVYTVFYATGLSDVRKSIYDSSTGKTTHTPEQAWEEELSHYIETSTSNTYFKVAATLTSITVPSNNEFYGTIDGVLYRKDASGASTVLVYAPRGKTGTYTVPKNVTYVESRAFARTSLTELIFEDYATNDPNFGQPLLKIGNMAGTSSSGQTASVTIGVSYTLQKLHLPSHLSELCDYAICYNYAMTDMTFGGDNSAQLTMGQYAIGYNTNCTVNGTKYEANIEKLALPNVALMANFALSATNMKEITFGVNSEITEIPYFGMSGNSKLEKVTLPASLKTLGRDALQGCTKLTTVDFAPGCELESISDSAFSGCGSLVEFIFPKTVSRISFGIFSSCGNLERVTISENMDSLWGLNGSSPQSMFDTNNKKLAEVIVPEGNPYMKSVDGVVYDKDMTTVMFYPFAKVPENGTFTAPDTVKKVGDYAFWNFQGTTINLPDNIEYIGMSAFANTKITSFVVDNTVKQIAQNAFSGCKQLTSFTFEGGSILEYIGTNAFANTAFETFNMPDTVTSIGQYPFQNSKLKVLHLSEGLTEIPTAFFSNTSNLEQVNIPSKVKTIGTRAFYGVKKVKSLTIPASVETINFLAFWQCSGLETITFEEDSKLSVISYRAFEGCSGLKSIEIPDSVIELVQTDYDGWEYEYIDTCHIFKNCTSLETVKLPAGISYIGLNMFEGCTNLKSVVMPREITSIGKSAFVGCESLESIDIPATVEYIGEYAFDGCASLEEVNIEEGINLVQLGEEGEESAIFRGTASLKSFVMPDSVEIIGSSLFEGSGLEKITISQNLEMIADYTFKNCANLKEFTIPATVLTIGAEAFLGCTSVEEINLPSGVEIIGNDAFEGAIKLKKVTLPDTLAQINGNPFRNCDSMEEVVNNSANFKFVDGVLYDVDGYTLIYAPVSTAGDIIMLDSVREIASGAFAGSKITSIIISDYVEAIPARTFMNCSELATVRISGNVKLIGDSAFEGCAKLESVFIPKSVEVIGNAAFKGCASITSAEFETRNTEFTLGASVFENCSSITAVELPSFVSKLPDYAFAGTGIVNLVIPESVTDLSGIGVFMNCTKLETVTWHDGIEGKLGARLFKNCSLIESITIPAGITALGGNMPGEQEVYDFDTYLDDYGSYDYRVGEVFMGCTNLRSVEFEEGISCGIYANTFRGCMQLTEIDWNVGDWWFADYALAGAGFEKFELNSLGEWGEWGHFIFADCPNLEVVYVGVTGYIYSGFVGCVAKDIFIDSWGDPYNDWWNHFDDLTAEQTVHVNLPEDYYATWEEMMDEGLISSDCEAEIIYNGQTYEEWLAAQEEQA